MIAEVRTEIAVSEGLTVLIKGVNSYLKAPEVTFPNQEILVPTKIFVTLLVLRRALPHEEPLQL